MAIKKHTLLLCILFFIVVTFAISKTAKAENIITGKRLEGFDRYYTNIAISKLGWTGISKVAVIATGEDFPDALSAAPLAGKYKAPILLTYGSSLSASLKSELKRLEVEKVYIVGGTGVVPKGISDQITSMGISCVRLAGSDRYETSAAVAREIGSSDTAVIATGENYPDALSIAPWAASKGIPVLLTEQNKLSPSTSEYIQNSSTSKIYIIGGTGVVSSSVAAKLPKDTVRINGNDRFATNTAVINTFKSDFDLGSLYLATGNNFPDALSGSALASLTCSPIVLTDTGLLPDTKKLIDSNVDKLNQVFFLGGDGVLSSKAISSILPPVVTGLEIDIPSTIVGLGKTMKASVNVTTIPEDAPKPVIVPAVDNTGIAGIDTDGVITGAAEGNVNVTASIGMLSASQSITVRDGKLIVLDPGHGGWSSGAVPVSTNGTKLTDSRESVLNLQITEKLRDKLESLGYKVVLTREGDTYKSLEDRAQISNNLNPDLFISIHHDSFSWSSTGTSSYYSNYKPGIDTSGVYVQAGGSGAVYDENGIKIGNMVKGRTYAYAGEDDGTIFIKFNGYLGSVSINDVMVYDNTPSIVSQKSRELAGMINSGISDLGLPKKGAFDKNLAVTRWTNSVSVLVEVGFLSNPYEFQIISQDSFQDKIADKITQAVQDYFSNN